MSTPDLPEPTPSFGDNVRIRRTPETEAAGCAGLTGQVYGFTTPSVTGVEVIGTPADDFALSVNLEERGEQLWFAADLVELVDHGVGTEVQSEKKFVRTAEGEWQEVPPDSPSLMQRLRHLFG